MSGNEIAKLSTVFDMNTAGVDRAFTLIKGGLQSADAKLTSFKTAVANSSKELQRSQLALQTYKIQLKQSGDSSDEAKNKLNGMTLAVERNKLALANNKSALLNYETSLKSNATASTGFMGALEGVGLSAQALTVGALAGLGVALGSLVTKTVGISAEFEQLGISFEVLAGGKEAGDELTKSLIKLASVTPMTSQGLADNARLLLSFGETNANIIPDLKMLGDVAGGNQEKLNSLALAFAQSGSTGRLMGQDLLQMVNVGFNPLQAISERTGKSMGQLKDEMEKGKIPFSQVRQAFIDVTSEGGRFYGMMEKQSGSLNGRISTMKDNWALLGKQIGDKFLPLAKATVEVLIGTADAIGQILHALAQFSRAIAQPFKIVIKTVYDNLPNGEEAKRIAAMSPKQRLQEQAKTAAKEAQKYKQAMDKANANAKTAPDAMNKQAYAGYAKEQKARYEASLKEVKSYQKKISDLDKAAAKPKPKAPVQTGFADSDKETKTKTKKGKSYDSQLNERADLLKAQSELDIASNDYTDAQILQKKIALQQQLISLYNSTSTKGKAERLQSQTELLNLEKQLDDKNLEDKIANMQAEANAAKLYKQMDLTKQLSDTTLTEGQKLIITNKAKADELAAEAKLQADILELKRKGVNDINQLSANDRKDYEAQKLAQLQAEQNFQQAKVDMAQQATDAEKTAAKNLSTSLTNGFRTMINGTTTVQDAFRNMLQNIAVNIAQSGIEHLLANLFKGAGVGGSGSVLSTALGAVHPALGAAAKFFGFANGGDPAVDQPRLVGERGPELEVPSSKKHIFTNKETKGILGGGNDEAQAQGIQPIIISNTIKVETMNGDNAVKTLQKPESKAVIQQIMKDSIKYNQAGIRNEVKNV